MNLEEMKLAVASKLPELVEIVLRFNEEGNDVYVLLFHGATRLNPYIECREINWPTEGLQVCHEAEKLMIADPLYNEGLFYSQTLRSLTSDTSDMWQWNATHEQRLEALCRVWWPERFE